MKDILTLWLAFGEILLGNLYKQLKDSISVQTIENRQLPSRKHVNCLGPPYIYTTIHHEIPNIIKYSRDGCLLMTDVLIGGSVDNDLVEFRSMAFGEHMGKSVLFIADATSGNSSVLIYDGKCDSHGHRHYIETVVNTTINEGANHCYGICFDKEGNVYISFQHTDNVLRYQKDTLKPMRLPASVRHDPTTIRPYYPGTFVQFGQPVPHDISEQGVRSIEFVGNNLWVCNEDINGIVIVNGHTGVTIHIISVIKPIGLHYRRDLGLVFVGSKVKHWQGMVYAFDALTFNKVRNFTNGRLNHPTGITSYQDDLFVGEIEAGQILKFSISRGKFEGVVVDYPPGEIEQLIMSDC